MIFNKLSDYKTMRWRNYSVFISSTFSDMHSERDYLQMYVFPEINKELKKYSISLRIIDLRWGVNTLDETADSIEEKVMRVCFDEIDRSRPFFIGLLGNRYGWVPAGSNDTFRTKKGIEGGGSITSMEIEYGFFLQEQKNGCLFMERCASCLDDMDELTREHYDDAYSKDEVTRTQSPIKLEKLKTDIRKQLAESGREECYQTYYPTWNGKKIENLEEFGNSVKQAIIRNIDSVFTLNQLDEPFFNEQTVQEQYLNTKLSKVHPRQKLVNQFVGLIKEKQGLFVISGPSGSGKSCIYALLVDKFRKFSDYIVLVHSTAASRESREFEQMLQRWNYQLENIFNLPHKDTMSVKDTIFYFSYLIKQTPTGKKLLMFVDAIDGFNRNTMTEYLSFYPRAYSDKWLMVCTSLPGCIEKLEKYHRIVENHVLPALEEDEAMAIIKSFTKFFCKELYSENLAKLMGKEFLGTPCYSSPLWLTIALLRIVNFNEDDFTQIALINKEFNKGVIEFINKQIEIFPEQEYKLFSAYLIQLDKIYDEMPSYIFKLLSVSYDGLNEDTMAALIGDKWSALTFATIKLFLSEFIVEQSGTKSWKIMHDKCKLQMEETEHRELCQKLARHYIEQLEYDKYIEDNVCYYLIQCEDNDLANRYFSLFHRFEDRILLEMEQICESMNGKSVLDFLFDAFTKRQGVRRYMPKSLIFWQLKQIITTIAKHFNKLGKYENTIAIMDTFYHFIENQRFSNDVKTVIYIIMETERDNAAVSVLTDEKRRELYLNAIQRAKIKGLLSLILSPLACKYYQWKIFNLKTKQ